jgi:subtilisin-like proprotein convertase family protein
MRVLSGKHVFHLIVASALAVAGLIAITPSPATAAGVPCRQTFSNLTDIAIPDESFAQSTIDVPENGLVITDVNVALDIDHTFTSDLVIYVDSYTDGSVFRGTSRLFNRDGGAADNLHGTVFDDSATTPISWGDPPFTGTFKPSRPLAALNGFTGGFFRLTAVDENASDTGTLRNWSATVTYRTCDLDSDGVEDHADKCLGISAHTATGCPLTTRAVTAKYKHGKFRGALSSPVAGCKSHRSVTIW